ncbi:hypothetical protein TorRG33x02_017230 [Trema orientale]|uniref:Uncharacterized protein n=1 Tax=Trema orientale TaxID=63057 RepID=A0A2P5FYA4_TREOI|nr:hypothetical protein TorRG33x02_017230 [Trema orientale]
MIIPSRKSVLDLLIFFKLASSGSQINHTGIVIAVLSCTISAGAKVNSIGRIPELTSSENKN